MLAVPSHWLSVVTGHPATSFRSRSSPRHHILSLRGRSACLCPFRLRSRRQGCGVAWCESCIPPTFKSGRQLWSAGGFLRRLAAWYTKRRPAFQFGKHRPSANGSRRRQISKSGRQLQRVDVAVKCDGGEVVQVVTKGKLNSASVSECSCRFRSAILPCCHIFATRHYFGLMKYDESLCSDRWSAKLSAQSVATPLDDEYGETEAVHVDKQEDVRILSSHQKFRKASVITAELASIASEGSMLEFSRRTDDLLCQWMNGHRVHLARECKFPEVVDTNHAGEDRALVDMLDNLPMKDSEAPHKTLNTHSSLKTIE